MKPLRGHLMNINEKYLDTSVESDAGECNEVFALVDSWELVDVSAGKSG